MSDSVQDLLATAVAELGGQTRQGQQQMADQVQQALESGEHLLIQAGTGTGKSLAYLVPLLAHALSASETVIVATATLALQNQIMRRDVPKLLGAIGQELEKEPKISLLKGRSNYVCKHKIAGGYPEEDAQSELFELPEAQPNSGSRDEQSGDQDFASGQGSTSSQGSTGLAAEVRRTLQWAEETETGDRDELLLGVSDRAWRQVSVTARECLGAQKCPLVTECFSEKAKAEAAQADLVVTNHALLALNALGEHVVLPEADAVVVDEAHELADRVTGALTGQLSGLMVTTAASGLRKQTALTVTELQKAGDELSAALAERDPGLLARGIDEELTVVLARVRDACRQALSDSKGGDDADGGRQVARARVQEIFELSERLVLAGERHEVVWLTGDDDAEASSIVVAPLSVAGTLRDSLFAEHTVVLTSATLAIGSAFDPVARQLGILEAADAETTGAMSWTGVDVGSPFNYPQQGILYIAEHLPRPERGISAEQLEELQALLEASHGGALGLFSSRRAAEYAAEQLRERTGLNILCQGESSLPSLIQEFAEDRDACLFGTMSLWQGVDVPGDSCRLVTIDRIPFPRPDDPLATARSRAVSQNGGNGFMAVSATYAAVRLAQGAGRLIRAAGDQGMVAVLDSRLATARYGGYLRAALPPFWVTKDQKVALAALGRLASERP